MVRFRDLDRPAVPTHFVTCRAAVIGAVNVERIAKNARRKKIVITCGVSLAPGREGFPTKRHDNWSRLWRAGHEPLFRQTNPLRVKAKFPRAIQV